MAQMKSEGKRAGENQCEDARRIFWGANVGSRSPQASPADTAVRPPIVGHRLLEGAAPSAPIDGVANRQIHRMSGPISEQSAKPPAGFVSARLNSKYPPNWGGLRK